MLLIKNPLQSTLISSWSICTNSTAINFSVGSHSTISAEIKVKKRNHLAADGAYKLCLVFKIKFCFQLILAAKHFFPSSS